MNTETQTDTSGPGRTTFDHAAIAADLESGMSAEAVAEKHGCSGSLVHRVRRRANGESAERTPRNEKRAAGLRTKIGQFQKHFDLLSKWQRNETDEGQEVTKIVTCLEEAIEKLAEAADLYEGLTEDIMKVKRELKRTTFEVGMVVCVKEKYRETYAAVCSSPEHLTVRGFRDTHVLIEDDSNNRLFVLAKELEVRKDA